jgi:hypothetical protein
MKTVAGFGIVLAVLATGARAQRDFDLEADSTVAPVIERTVRMDAADFNPQVALVPRDLKGFGIKGVQITRSRIGAFMQSALGGGDRSYDAYVSFQEDGNDRCMSLELKWDGKTEAWKASHVGTDDRCTPFW